MLSRKVQYEQDRLDFYVLLRRSRVPDQPLTMVDLERKRILKDRIHEYEQYQRKRLILFVQACFAALAIGVTAAVATFNKKRQDA
jgi:hypothetical protein